MPRTRPERAQVPAATAALFQRTNIRATVLASVPWFLQDLGTYGIGLFTPTILAAAIGHKSEHAQSVADLVGNDLIAAKGAAFIDILLIVGVVAAVLLADRLDAYRCRFPVSSVARSDYWLLRRPPTIKATREMVLIFTGFMLFNFMTNLGPNAQTYLIAGEVFPTAIRAIGAGFAASFAKIGACMTAFLFPILLTDIGTAKLLYILVGTSLLGAAITWLFRIETAGVNLEEIGARDDAEPMVGPTPSPALIAPGE